MFYEKVKKYLEKIKEKDGEIGAFIEVYEEEALEKAELLDKKVLNGEKLGKLAGKIVSIKNNIAYKGKKLTCASKFLENYIAPYNSTVVEKLNSEDAIIIGSTNMDEFACGSDTTKSALKITKNPLNFEYVPGGSSGGSAASVAADLCEISLGSDTGGSIRCPAAFCGIVGFKPTYGAVSRFGLVDMAMSLDQIGPLAKNVNDAEIIFDVIKGTDEKDQTTFTFREVPFRKPQKLLIPVEMLENLDKDLKENFEKLVENLKSIYKIEKISIRELRYAIPIYYLTVFAEFYSAMQKYDGLRYGKLEKIEEYFSGISYLRERYFGEEVKRRIFLGSFITGKEQSSKWYRKTKIARSILAAKLSESLKNYNFIISPTMSTLPWKIGEKIENPLDMYLADILTVPANLAGLPAGSVPYGNIGKFKGSIQVIGSKGSDKIVLAIMKDIERLDGDK